MAEHETDDELWNEFRREFAKNDAVREPAAAAGRRPRFALVLGCLAAAAAVVVYQFWPAPVVKKTAISASTTVTAPATAVLAPGAPTQAAPLTVFPERVQGYTRVASVADDSCTGSDTVGPTLAGLITQSHGCAGVALALYKDAENNEYSLALFTMNDPLDAVTLLTRLSADPTDDQVAVQLPPEDSGLRELPTDSGLVQSFASSGRSMLVGMAQWSDGRSSDYQNLEDRLAPLLDTVSHGMPL